MLVGTHSKVLDGLTRVALAAEQNGVCARGRTQGKLIEGENLAAGLEDALLGRGSEAQGSNRQLGHLEQAHVVSDCADRDNHLGITVRRILGLLDDARKGDRRAVCLREEETVEDGLEDCAKSESE